MTRANHKYRTIADAEAGIIETAKWSLERYGVAEWQGSRSVSGGMALRAARKLVAYGRAEFVRAENDKVHIKVNF